MLTRHWPQLVRQRTALQPANPFFTKDLQLGNDSMSDSQQDGVQTGVLE
jgi:hypothetical protein